jgi:hypothetical protein
MVTLDLKPFAYGGHMQLKPRKIAVGIEQEARRMGRELELQVMLGVTTVEEFASLQEEVLERVHELEDIGPDLPAAHAILEWIRSLSHEVHRKRYIWEARERLAARLDALIDVQGLREVKDELHKVLSSFENVEDARRWLRDLNKQYGRKCNQALSDLRVTVTSREVTTMTIGVRDDGQCGLSCLEDRASKAKGPKAEALYTQGVAALKRRDKIRFFKGAVHEGVLYERSTPRVAKRRHTR